MAKNIIRLNEDQLRQIISESIEDILTTNDSNEIQDEDMYIEEYLENIVNSANESPEIYDDTETWVANDYFEYWQNEYGDWDEVKNYIAKYANRKCVAGWFTEDSFKATENIIPQKMKDIMSNNKSTTVYKTDLNQMDIWQTKDNGFVVTVMKFENHVNDFGADYAEFWYMIAVEE